MAFPRPCNRCEKKFLPTSPHCRICEKCESAARLKGILKLKKKLKNRKTNSGRLIILETPKKYKCKSCGEEFNYIKNYSDHLRICKRLKSGGILSRFISYARKNC